jgi:MFS transporter, ACS family, tartrate transporter
MGTPQRAKHVESARPQPTSVGAHAAEPGEAAIGKVLRRLLPVLMLLMMMNLVDRTNISFAALQMNADLGFSASVYGLGAGIFFVGYFLCEVPSNLIMVRVGARAWLTRIMISWGAVVLFMAWIQGARSFYGMRLLLGVAEAGLLPGVLLYLARWIPGRRLGFAYSLLMSTTAIANVVSGPIAGALLELDGTAGLRGWQIMFIAEGLPTMVLGCLISTLLPERPVDTRWLNEEERRWLATTIEQEDRSKHGSGVTSFVGGFFDRRVLSAILVGFLFVCCNFGTVFWLPQIIGSWGRLSPFEIGLLAGVPYLLGGVATVTWARHSDRTLERRWHLVCGGLLGSVGYALAAIASGPAGAFLGLCIAAIGIWSMFGVFWAYVGNLLGGAAAPGGLAVVNSFSTLGGFLGPVAMGIVRDRSHGFGASLLVLAIFALFTAAAGLLIRDIKPPKPLVAPGIM